MENNSLETIFDALNIVCCRSVAHLRRDRIHYAVWDDPAAFSLSFTTALHTPTQCSLEEMLRRHQLLHLSLSAHEYAQKPVLTVLQVCIFNMTAYQMIQPDLVHFTKWHRVALNITMVKIAT